MHADRTDGCDGGIQATIGQTAESRVCVYLDHNTVQSVENLMQVRATKRLH